MYEPLSGSLERPQPNSACFMFAAMSRDLGLLNSSPVFGLAAPQHHIVGVLEERARDLGVGRRRGHRVGAVTQDEDAITLDVTEGTDTSQLWRARDEEGEPGSGFAHLVGWLIPV
ncbi:hypothetical protein [Streptomyces sasae]|uniref:hypothetical protein n=1 Tax=Streptomyces sasae TaxID=1266772 RepID=UPI00292DD84A|nr:hypothetical protein [Streptomyces sasae]